MIVKVLATAIWRMCKNNSDMVTGWCIYVKAPEHPKRPKSKRQGARSSKGQSAKAPEAPKVEASKAPERPKRPRSKRQSAQSVHLSCSLQRGVWNSRQNLEFILSLIIV